MGRTLAQEFVNRAGDGDAGLLAKLEPEFKARVQKVALDAYRVRDYGRIDLRMAESGDIYVIEVNANCYLE